VRARIPAIAVAICVLSCATLYITHDTAAYPRKAVRSSYTTADIIEYLAFAQGPVARDHPGSKTQLKPAAMPAESRLRTVSQSLSECVHRLDATAGSGLTAAFNTADARRLDHALRRFDAAVTRWLTSASQTAPCPPPPPPPKSPPAPQPYLKLTGVGWLDYVFAGWDFYAAAVTVGAAAAISGFIIVAYAALFYEAGALVTSIVAALEAFWIPILLSYEFVNGPTELDRQMAIAHIIEKLQT
jgi:hypothetical protein